jgi:NADH-quinone oxidoreductase subunit N
MIAAVPRPPVDWFAISPSLILLLAAGACLMVAVLVPGTARRATAATITAGGFVGAFVAAILLYDRTPVGLSVYADTVRRDRFFALAAIILAAVGLVAVLVSYTEHRHGHVAEYYALLATAAAGMMFLTQANSLMTLFLGLEWFSISLYILCAIDYRRERSLEAGLKYLVIGGFGSAVLLFGSALVYGATGKLTFDGIAEAVTAGGLQHDALLLTGLAMIIVGLGFKASAAPFHMWTPDVYEGAPTSVTAFMSAATKVAAFLALIRVLDVAFQPLSWDWTPVIWVLAAASVILGSVFAIAQSDIKRMLAYSSIAHAGFILTGLTSSNQIGIRAAMFYLVSYALMTLGAFGVVMLVSARGEEQTSLTAYAGLSKRSPLLAGLMTLFLLSLAGIPPTVGFVAKVGVFSAAIRAGHTSLALVGVVASVVAAFFYLRVIVLMYMQEPQGSFEEDRSLMPRVAIAIPAILTLALGIFPGLIAGILERASILRW